MEFRYREIYWVRLWLIASAGGFRGPADRGLGRSAVGRPQNHGAKAINRSGERKFRRGRNYFRGPIPGFENTPLVGGQIRFLKRSD